MVSCKYAKFSSFCLNAGFLEGYRNKHLFSANRHSPLLVQAELLSEQSVTIAKPGSGGFESSTVHLPAAAAAAAAASAQEMVTF